MCHHGRAVLNHVGAVLGEPVQSLLRAPALFAGPGLERRFDIVEARAGRDAVLQQLRRAAGRRCHGGHDRRQPQQFLTGALQPRAQVGVIAAVVLRHGQGQRLHGRAADGASPAHFHRRYPLDDLLRLHGVVGRGGVSRTTYR